jgi:hypothetical protein
VNTSKRLVGWALLSGVTLALLPGWLVLRSGVRAQAPAGQAPGKVYTSKNTFRLPIKMDDRTRANLREVYLYVRTNGGDWVRKEVAPPSQPHFTYTVPGDGEYWFCVVLVDRAGQPSPSDPNRVTPGLIVVVDTQPPDIAVRPLPVATGEVYLQCDVRDANPEPRMLKLDYQAADKSWRPLEPIQDNPSVFRIPDPDVLTGWVRATATDKAGNTATREINLAPSANATASASPGRTETQAQKVTPPAPGREASETVQTGVLPDKAPPTSRQFLGTTHASLEYQVDQPGPSGVSKVEVYMTRDYGETWQLLCDDPDRQSPAEIDLPGDGLYGLSVVVTNGSGVSTAAPSKGDTPDWWVEVDTTKPVAKVQDVIPTTAGEPEAFMITWSASDKNLGPEPIDLYYATRPDGPWQPIAKGVKNDGSYRWALPRNVGGQFFVRMDVTDQAGNVCRCDAQGPAILELARPKVRVLGIAGVPRPTPPTGN